MTKQCVFSIIVPTYNRPMLLAKCLQSLTNLDFPRDEFELIVVDDGGHIDLTAVITPMTAQLNIRLVRQANSGPATARNHGASVANGRYLAFLDDDCRPDPNWLAHLADSLAVAPTALVGGCTINALPQNPYAAASQTLVAYLYAYYNDQEDGAAFFTSNNFALAAACFREIGGFDTTMPLAAGEDREFCDRWQQAGHELFYVPEAVVFHSQALTLRTFWRQHFNYGRRAYQFHRLRAARRQTAVRIEPLSFYWRLLGFPFREGYGRSPWTVAFLLCISQIANAVGFLIERMVEK